MLLIKNELITSPLVLGRLAGRVKSTRSRWKMYARLWKSHRAWFLSDAACEFVNLRDVKTHTLGADVAPVGTVGIHTTRLEHAVCRVWFFCTLICAYFQWRIWRTLDRPPLQPTIPSYKTPLWQSLHHHFSKPISSRSNSVINSFCLREQRRVFLPSRDSEDIGRSSTSFQSTKGASKSSSML